MNKIEKMSEDCFKIWVKEAPTEGKANEAVIKILADHFGIAASRVEIISGRTVKKKIIKII